MTSAFLESLSTDLILAILQQLSSPTDLYKLICASPVYYQVFTRYKLLVLTAVVQNAIPQEVLPDALAACDASGAALRAIEATLPYGIIMGDVAWGEIGAIIRDFMENYLRRDSLYSHRSRGLPLMVSLCRLWASVDFFISGYKQEAFKQIRQRLLESNPCQKLYDDNVSDEGTELSKIELCRLQRAFFRFEIYRRLFPFRKCLHLAFGACFQALWFMSKFRDWEQEEFACVYDYLIVYTQDVFDKLEDEFVKTVEAGAQAAKEASEPVTGGECLNSSRLELLGLSHFTASTKRLSHEQHILLTIAYGLPYLKKLDVIDHSMRLALLTSYGKEQLLPPLIDVFRQSPRAGGERSESIWPSLTTAFVDTSSNWNMGWIWARAAQEVNYHKYRPEDCSIISMGYVFWDVSRLRAMGVLDVSRQSLKQTPRRARRELPSAEERLGAVQVSDYLLDFLKNKYAPFFLADGEEPDLERLDC
ncbi:hypothetical protein MMC32_001882 [Xylographa parallela]|nr:hypothetical protein [Xylographa parallela]